MPGLDTVIHGAPNVLHVAKPGKPQRLDAAPFPRLKQDIERRLPPAIDAVLMVWTWPGQGLFPGEALASPSRAPAAQA